MDQTFINQRLARFEQEGIVSRLVLKKDYDNYGIGKPDPGKTEFVSTKSEIDNILKLPLSEQSLKLGIPIEQLQGGEVLRVDFKLSAKHKVEMPSGNEFGKNQLWLPGGKLPDGNLEAIIKTEGMVKDIDYTVKNVSSNALIGKLVQNGNKIEYTNPAGKIIKWSEQSPKDIQNSIKVAKRLDIEDPNNIGRITEAKVGDFVMKRKELTGFGQKINPSITDLDVTTLGEIIEVKASFSSVKENQFDKLLDSNLDNFCNPNKKNIILYIDAPLNVATPVQLNMINRIKSKGVTVVHSLDELGKILK